MKVIFLLLLVCMNSVGFGQPFKNDWFSFTPLKNWNLEIVKDTSSFLGKTIHGKLILTNNKNDARRIVYYVYHKSDMDSVFQKRIHDWMMGQSCSTFTSGKINFSSFEFREYDYLLQPCHQCNVGMHKECEKFAKQLMGYILKKE